MHQLRQILAEIGIQRLDPFHGGIDQFAGAFGAGIGRAEAQDFIEQALAQVAFDTHRHGIGADFAAPGQHCPQKDDQEDKFGEVPQHPAESARPGKPAPPPG